MNCKNLVRFAHLAAMQTLTFALSVTCFLMAGPLAQADDEGGQRILPDQKTVSTIPANGDVNPYGVAFVPNGYPQGTLQPDDILVSNFNNAPTPNGGGNLQGTGTTIVRITPQGTKTLFFQASPHSGLSTALNISKQGPIFVGDFPSVDGTCATASPGSILVINSQGKQIASFANAQFINGPWDSTLFEGGGRSKLFVSNALSGTVSRLDFDIDNGQIRLVDAVQIASGYLHRCDPVTFVVGPTGLVYDADKDTLFISSTGENAVFAVHGAGTTSHDQGKGQIIYEDNIHLHGALAMAEAPNGHLVVSNSDGINPDPNQPSELVEFTKDGKFVAQLSVDLNPGGAFGLGFGNPKDGTVRFAAVDDNTSTLTIWKLLFDANHQ
jgi:hypothetical protein